MRLKYPEFKWVVIGCCIAFASTVYQCQHPQESEMQSLKITLPPREQETPAINWTKKGLCKRYNHSGSACEALH